MIRNKVLSTLMAAMVSSAIFTGLGPAVPTAWASSAPPSTVLNGQTWYEVSTAAQLEFIDENQGTYQSSHIMLMNNIDVSGFSWSPFVGTYSAVLNRDSGFTGTFNGRGFGVSGVDVNYYYTSGYSYFGGIGFFGYVNGATIENVAVSGSITHSSQDSQYDVVAHVGGLVGVDDGGTTISHCSFSGTVTGQTSDILGGLFGLSVSGNTNISNSFASGVTIYPDASGASGLARYNPVTNGESGIGGLVGDGIGVSVHNCYAYTMMVGNNGNDMLGGLVGIGGNVVNSYASTTAYGFGANSLVGGLVGQQSSGNFTNSYFNTTTMGNISGAGDSASATGITGVSLSAMRAQSTYANWDFTGTWAINSSVNNGFPYLRPTIVTQSLPVAAVDQPYSVSLFANNNAQGGLSWSATGLPSGMSLSNSGVLSGTAAQTGTYPITVTVKDAVGTTASESLSLTVNSVLVNAATPSIQTQPTDQTVTAFGSFSLSVAASVSDAGSLSYQWYINTSNSTTGGTAIGGATGSTYSWTDDGYQGIYYFYVVVTNTNAASRVTGSETASTTSDVATVTVTELPSSDAPPVVGGLYAVSTPAQLEYIDQNQSVYLGDAIALMNDIDLSGFNWNPFGSSQEEFYGFFLGQGHTVTHLNVNTSAQYAGFFGKSSGVIENLGVRGSVTDNNSSSDTGGLVGDYVEGYSGFFGVNSTNPILNCYAAVTVNSSGEYTGGLVGYENANADIQNSYATGSVSGTVAAGGLVGGEYGTISQSYATGRIIADRDAGGLVGIPGLQTPVDSYFDTNTSGVSRGIGEQGLYQSYGRSTADMQSPSTFSSWSTSDWTFYNGQYPLLAWQVPLGISTDTPTSVSPGGQVTVTGSVYSSGGSPLSGMNVTLSDNASGSWANSSVTTDSSGRFTDTWTAPSTTTTATITASVVGASVQHQSTIAIHDPTITYNGNGNTGGSAPTDSNTYQSGGSVTVASVGTLTKTGYTFAGWNTNADGSGTSYTAGSTLTMGSSSVTLYAQWTVDSSGTGGAGGNGGTSTGGTGGAGGNGGNATAGTIALTTSSQSVVAGQSVTVSGVVYQQGTQSTLANTPVTLSASAGSWINGGQSVTSTVYSVYTGSQGDFELEWGAPTTPGVYTLSASSNGSMAQQSVDVTKYITGTVTTQPITTSTTANVVQMYNNVASPNQGSSAITLNIVSGTFSQDIPVWVTSTANASQITPSGTQVVAAVGVNFSGTPQKPITLTIQNANIAPGDAVYKILPDGTYQQLPSSAVTIVAGQAKISFSTDPNFIVTQPTTAGGPTPPTVITMFFPEPAQVGQAYSAQVREIGGVASMKWTITSGVLPPGLTLSNQGVISGTPTSAGNYTFTVKVTDANGLSSSKQLTLTVNGTNPGSGSNNSGGASTPNPPTTPVSVTTNNEQAATIGQLYHQTLQATGGQTPYTWSIVSGALPAGLSLNPKTGVISGTPIQTGAYHVTVQVKGADGTTSNQTITIDLLKSNQREVLWNGTVKNVPAIVKEEGTTPTTYMPIWYVMQLLKPMGITSTWDGTNWHMATASQPPAPALSNIQAGRGPTGIYLDGTLVQEVTTMAAKDPSSGKATTYMPIWYVMQLLKRVGLQSTWNGTTWIVTK